MPSGASKSSAFAFLIFNTLLYGIITIIASWAVNHGIERSRETASVLSIPAHIFPIYFPMGNMASGFLIIFSLIAGVVGMVTSIICIINVIQWNPSNQHAAASSSLVTLLLTLLAMGLACKEINMGWTDSNLRTLETLVIIVSGSQLLTVGTIQAGIGSIEHGRRPRTGERF